MFHRTDAYNFYKFYDGGTLNWYQHKAIWVAFATYVREQLLENKAVVFGQSLGSLFLYKTKAKNKMIDWGETKKFKQYLIDSGEELYNKETKKGKPYIIYYDDPERVVIRWYKDRLFMSSCYRFKRHNKLKLELVKKIRESLTFINNLTPYETLIKK